MSEHEEIYYGVQSASFGAKYSPVLSRRELPGLSAEFGRLCETLAVPSTVTAHSLGAPRPSHTFTLETVYLVYLVSALNYVASSRVRVRDEPLA